MTPGKFELSQLSASGRFRWRLTSLASRTMLRLRKTATVQHDEPHEERDGQSLAGSGALVFEGELLETPRRTWR